MSKKTIFFEGIDDDRGNIYSAVILPNRYTNVELPSGEKLTVKTENGFSRVDNILAKDTPCETTAKLVLSQDLWRQEFQRKWGFSNWGYLIEMINASAAVNSLFLSAQETPHKRAREEERERNAGMNGMNREAVICCRHEDKEFKSQRI